MPYANPWYNYRTNTMHWFEYRDDGIREEKKTRWIPSFYVNKAGTKFDATSIYGHKLTKISPRTWGDYKDKREQYKGMKVPLFESDVRPEPKFLNEVYGQIDIERKIPELDIHYLDIESEISDEGFVTGEEASQRINLISVYSTKLNKTMVFGLEKDFSKKKKDVKYIRCPTEQALLINYLKFHRKNSPDILTGWNIENYDIPYIVNRIGKVLGTEMKGKYSPFNSVRWNERGKCYEIAGISVLDYMELYKKLAQGNRERYSLEFICNHEKIKIDGESKKKYKGSLKDFYTNHWEEFVEYNIQDSNLVRMLEEKLNYIRIAVFLTYSSRVLFQDAFSMLRVLDGAMLLHCHRMGKVVPDRGEVHKIESFEGAYVFDPEPGFYDWVVGWDVSSLYPSCMRMLNISPETKRYKILSGNYFDKNYPIHMDCLIDHKPTVIKNHEDMLEFLKTENLCISHNQILYTNENLGICPSILDGWYNARKAVQKKKKFYDQKAYAEKDKKKKQEYKDEAKRLFINQLTLKLRMNSLYGYIGTVYSRFFDADNAMAVTLTGQKILKGNDQAMRKIFPKLINKNLEGEEFPTTIYGDTDSIYLHYGYIIREVLGKNPSTDEEWLTECHLASKYINKFLERFNNRQCKIYNAPKNIISFEGEAIDKAAIFLCKKRYMTWVVHDGTPCDKLEYKGIEIVKSSTPALLKEYLKEVVGMIIRGKDRSKINDRVKEIYDEFMDKPIEEIGFPRSANNIEKYGKDGTWKKGTPIHIKASIIYNHMLKEMKLKDYKKIYSGDKMSYVYLKDHSKYETIGFIEDFPEEFNLDNFIDRDKQFDKGFVSPIQQFYDAMKWGEINFQFEDLLA